jgi:hypothetical protein
MHNRINWATAHLHESSPLTRKIDIHEEIEGRKTIMYQSRTKQNTCIYGRWPPIINAIYIT